MAQRGDHDGAASPTGASAEAAARVPFAIDAPTLAGWMANGECALLIDVREAWERDICAIAGSRLVPMGEIPDRLDELPRDRPFVVYCHHGGRSFQVVLWLRRTGFANAVNLEGGIEAWSTQVDSRVPTY